MGLLQRHSSKFLQKSRTDSNEFSSHSMAVKRSVSKSSISATTAILSTSLTAPTTWYLPVLTKALAGLLPIAGTSRVTTTSFLSPNFARASRSALTPPMDGSLKLENCLKPATAAGRVGAASGSAPWRRPAAVAVGGRCGAGGGGWAGVVSGRRAGVAGGSPADPIRWQRLT